MAHDVFISYSSHDVDMADMLLKALESPEVKIRCWIAPRDVPGGTDFAKEIVTAITECSVMVLVFSANAKTSPEVDSEVYIAFSNEKPIIPFRIENVVPEGAMVYRLGKRHWVNALTPPLETRIGELTTSVGKLIGNTRLGPQNPPQNNVPAPSGTSASPAEAEAPFVESPELISFPQIDKVVFKLDWPTLPGHSTLHLHVDQPLFEDFPGEWFYRGRIGDSCPDFYRLLLASPGITSVSRSSPYELSMGKAELAQLEAIRAHIEESLKTMTGVQQVTCLDSPVNTPGTSRSPKGHPKKTVQPTVYTDGDWITAALVARERAEVELKRVASAVGKLPNSELSENSKRAAIVSSLQRRLQQLTDKHASGGTTDDTRLEACVAKVVAEIIDSELAEFEWMADDRSQDDPLLVFRDTIKSLRRRHQ